jgi:serine/threonine-protein kinase HipA
MLIFHYLVGNADAHAKNYALLYQDGTPDLAPLYDVVCTAAYPRLAKKMAMQIGGRSLPDTILLENWLTLVPATKSAQRLLTRELAKMTSEIGEKADTLLEELGEAGIYHPILKTVRRIIETRAKLLLSTIAKA